MTGPNIDFAEPLDVYADDDFLDLTEAEARLDESYAQVLRARAPSNEQLKDESTALWAESVIRRSRVDEVNRPFLRYFFRQAYP
jgi:hypothetical protein